MAPWTTWIIEPDRVELACPAGGQRPLTSAEIALASSMFASAIDYAKVTVRRRKWFALQPVRTVMAPCGHLHFHPDADCYRDDFGHASLAFQGLFIHEMTHVWQAQSKGRFYLPLHRHPFCQYDYTLRPGWDLARYGLEQQAEIVRHAFLLERGEIVPGAPGLDAYRAILPFQR